MNFRVVGTYVEAQNPRTMNWDIVTNFLSEQSATTAAEWYRKQDYKGWTSTKISKSNQ